MFRAYDSQRERLVAVKLFKLDLPPDQVHRLVSAFERLVAADLTHAAVCAPLSTGISGVCAYLAQDYVAAESLDLAVREHGPAPPSHALRVAAHLAGALDFAAVASIHHGALHPRDVLLSTDETRLTGVGVTQALEQVGVAAPVRRPYTAPERIAGGTWDRRADVFSLAALTHELLWAKRVTGTGSQATDALTPLDGADQDALRAAFARGLADDPHGRFDTALEFVEALKRAFPNVTLKEPVAPKRRPVAAVAAPTSPLDEAAAAVVVPVEPGLPEAPGEAPTEAPANVTVYAASDGDLPLAAPDAAEERGYQDIEVEPAIVEPPDPRVDQAAPLIPAGLIDRHGPEPFSVLEESRSAVWPLMLSLLIGIALGYAGGYFVGTRERPAPGVTAATAAAPGVMPPVREFTEGAVAPSPKPAQTVPPPVAPAPASPTSEAPVPLAAKPEGGSPTSQGGSGRLLVRSTPAGAQVTVDGRESGRTPATVRNLATGAHVVRIARDGYTPAERRVVLTLSRPSQSMTVTLARARASAARGSGGLTIVSRPAGAKVFLDGKLLGTTPVTVQAVAAGDHAVRLERDGYRRWSSSVKVVASENNRVTASLEK